MMYLNILHLLSSIVTPFSFSLSKDGKKKYLTNKIRLLSLISPSFKKKYKDEIDHLKTLEETSSHFEYIIPYSYTKRADHTNEEVFLDEDHGLFYVLHNGKRLYFNEKYDTVEKVKYSYYSLKLEQDKRSPHRYTNDQFSINDGAVVADVGTAEGIFSLDIIEKVSRIYMFEADNDWQKALMLTFDPWKDKICIVSSFVSNVDDEDNIRLDTYFKDKHVDFFKIDVDGAERLLIQGASDLIKNKKANFAITTYHNQSDAAEFQSFFSERGYKTSFSEGNLLFLYGKLKPPYFRKAVLRVSA